MLTTIEAYQFELRKKRQKKWLDFGENPDFFELISDKEDGIVRFVDTGFSQDVPSEKKILRIPKQDSAKGTVFYGSDKENRTIYGILETGLYGKKYDVSGREDPKETLFQIKKEEAVMKPFFYLIKIPRQGTKGYIIAERTDNESILPLLRLILLTYCKCKFNEKYVFVRNSIITKEYYQLLQNGRYSSISMNIDNVPQDLSDRYFGKFESEQFTVEMKIKFKKSMSNISERKLKQRINEDTALFTSPVLNEIFDNSEKKIVSSIQEKGIKKTTKERTFYLSQDQKHLIRPYYTLEVVQNSNGFSEYNSMRNEIKNFIEHNKEFRIFD